MNRLLPLLAGVAVLALPPLPAGALDLAPADLYAQVAPAVAALELRAAAGDLLDSRSAIRIGPHRYVTVCEDLAAASRLTLVTAAGAVTAELSAEDSERNLCVLTVADGAPGPSLGLRHTPPRAGMPVYAVANALGFGVGIADGLVGGVRTFASGDYIQFSAPVSPGSQGGALVDATGALVGVIEYRHRSGQNVNFAAPAAWIDEIDRRSESQRVDTERDHRAVRLARNADWTVLERLVSDWQTAAPASIRSWEFAALAAEQQGQLARAEAAWQAVQRLDPERSTGDIGLAKVLLRQGRVAEALALTEKLIVRDRQDAAVWLLYGQALRAANRSADAETAFRRTTELDPWQLRAYAQLAGLAEARGDFLIAAALWTRLSGLYPTTAEFRYQQLHAELQAGRPERALAVLDELPDAARDSAEANYWRGLTLRQLARPVDAVAALRRSLAQSMPGAPHTWIALAVTLHALRRHPEAIDAAARAREQAPDDPDTRFWLAVQLKDGGRATEALALSRALVAERPADPAAWRLQGLVLAVLGQGPAAIPALEQSLALDPKQGKVWAVLAEVLHGEGREDAARRAYEQLRTVDPPYARQLYQTLIVTYEEAAP